MANAIFNAVKMLAIMATGMTFEGVLYTFKPVTTKPGGGCIIMKDCPKCKAKGKAFVFKSEQDNDVFGVVCKDCHKHTIRRRPKKEEVATPPAPYHAQCVCGQDLPEGRKKFCYDCRPAKQNPTVVDNGDGSASIKGEMVGYGM